MAVQEGSTGIIRISKACSSLAPHHTHLLPCSISFTGPAPVTDYFRPKTTDSIIEGVEVKEAAFRGRKLLGLFLEKDASAEGGVRGSDDASTVDVWNAKATFKDITYWRHDDNPHSIESGHKFFDWLRLASMMHKPVSAEEVVMEQIKTGKSGQKRKLEQT